MREVKRYGDAHRERKRGMRGEGRGVRRCRREPKRFARSEKAKDEKMRCTPALSRDVDSELIDELEKEKINVSYIPIVYLINRLI